MSKSDPAGSALIPRPIAFWDFQEPSGSPRRSTGRHKLVLEEQCGPLERVSGGPCERPFSLRLRHGQWLRLPREDCPGLNLHGKQPLTLVAWVRLLGERPWQFIAGMWDERARRQYGLFVNGTKQYDSATDDRRRARMQVHGYLSDTGGKSPGKEACFSYATGATALKTKRWYCLASVWDGSRLAVYLDGRLDANATANPIPFNAPIFNGIPSDATDGHSRWADLPGADFTVGQHGHVQWLNYPKGSGPQDEGFDGCLGGLAVFDQALPADALDPTRLANALRQSLLADSFLTDDRCLPLPGILRLVEG